MLQSTESDSWLASNDPIIIDSTMHDDLFYMHIETDNIDLMMDYLASSIFVTWVNCTLFYQGKHNAGLLNTIWEIAGDPTISIIKCQNDCISKGK